MTPINFGWIFETLTKRKIMTQHAKILKHLNAGKTLSQKQASHLYGITCLRGRVTELRQSGHPITTTKNTLGKTAYRRAI